MTWWETVQKYLLVPLIGWCLAISISAVSIARDMNRVLETFERLNQPKIIELLDALENLEDDLLFFEQEFVDGLHQLRDTAIEQAIMGQNQAIYLRDEYTGTGLRPGKR